MEANDKKVVNSRIAALIPYDIGSDSESQSSEEGARSEAKSTSQPVEETSPLEEPSEPVESRREITEEPTETEESPALPQEEETKEVKEEELVEEITVEEVGANECDVEEVKDVTVIVEEDEVDTSRPEQEEEVRFEEIEMMDVDEEESKLSPVVEPPEENSPVETVEEEAPAATEEKTSPSVTEEFTEAALLSEESEEEAHPQISESNIKENVLSPEEPQSVAEESQEVTEEPQAEAEEKQKVAEETKKVEVAEVAVEKIKEEIEEVSEAMEVDEIEEVPTQEMDVDETDRARIKSSVLLTNFPVKEKEEMPPVVESIGVSDNVQDVVETHEVKTELKEPEEPEVVEEPAPIEVKSEVIQAPKFEEPPRKSLLLEEALRSGKSGSSSLPLGLLTLSKNPITHDTQRKYEDPPQPPGLTVEAPQPRLEPITLKLFKDNLTVRTEGGQWSPHRKSNDSSPKQLEFTLKIAKDSASNLPKAAMSPKSSHSPRMKESSSALSPSSPMNKITLKLPKDDGHPEIKTETVDLTETPDPLPEKRLKVEESSFLTDSILKEALTQPVVAPPVLALPVTPAPKKRGRPRKIQVTPKPEEDFITDVSFDSSFDGSPGDASRPVRSCRGRTRPIVTKTRRPRGGGVGRGGGRRTLRDITAADIESLSDYEKAELAKIEAKKEKLKADRLAKIAAKKAKVLAKKLKDEERRKRIAREKAEALAQAALQVFEEDTRMSAPDSMHGRVNLAGDFPDESQSSFSASMHNKKGRMEIPLDYECHKDVRVEQLAEYQWQGSELYMIQEQISQYLGVKSFKRKYPDLKRRPVEAEERTFLEESGLVPKSMCDLGLTAVSSAEVLDIMFHDFPDKYEEFRKHVREKQAREASYKQRAFMASTFRASDKVKMDTREHAIESAAVWNAKLNRDRKNDRRCSLDLQTFCIHYPKSKHASMTRNTPRLGNYPVALIPGQYCDYYKIYTSDELRYFPLNTVVFGPMKPNERNNQESVGSQSDSEESSSSDESSDSSSEASDGSNDDSDSKCKTCQGSKKKNKNGQAELLIQCGQCSSLVHPSCQELSVEMVPHVQKYAWQCTDCKTCMHCKDPSNDEKMLFCDLCDRGYHIYCVGLHRVPDGRWHCVECSFCANCGVRDPGGPDWQHEWQHMYKKGERGTRTYQLTLCVACSKLWRKGNYCQICQKCYSFKPEDEPDLQQCNTCDRYLHKDCYASKVTITSKVQSNGFQCGVCLERVQTAISFSAANNSTVVKSSPAVKG